MNFLNLCDSFGFSFMISKVLEFIHSLILNYLTYLENVSLYNEAMKSACVFIRTASTSSLIFSHFQILLKY